MTRAVGSPLAGRALAALVLVLPFEPRWPTLSLLGLQWTFLEAAAAVSTVIAAWFVRRRLGALLRRPPLSVACLSAFAAVHLLSAVAAPAHREAAAVYSLRMTAAAALAVIVAACERRDVHRMLRAVIPMALVVAGFAILEGAGLRALDPFLNLFRATAYVYEGSRRASAASESPNLAAALLAHGLVVAAGFASLAAAPARRTALLAVPLSVGLLLTYSRGGLVAAVVGTAVLLRALPRKARRAPLAALASLVGVVALLASGDSALRRRMIGPALAEAEGARYEPLDAALVLQPGETRAVSARVVNTGSKTWLPSSYRLTCAWFRDGRFLDAGCAAELSRPVPPGESIVLQAVARAPEVEGSYFLAWNVVGGSGLFSFLGIPPGLVPAAVGERGAAALPSNPPSFVSRRSRWELWKLASGMWLERPLLGFGPDNYRKMHEAFAGWPSGREGLADYAHSAYLEAAASTGSLGLLTLLATLLATLGAAWRVAAHAPGLEDRVAAAALTGLLAGIAAHSAVDHLLGFTSEYLFFGCVVGGAAALGRREDLSEATAAA